MLHRIIFSARYGAGLVLLWLVEPALRARFACMFDPLASDARRIRPELLREVMEAARAEARERRADDGGLADGPG